FMFLNERDIVPKCFWLIAVASCLTQTFECALKATHYRRRISGNLPSNLAYWLCFFVVFAAG
ncbi:MAG: hypothetical protein ACPGD8_07425, partial [Flavobacteriales bacterium]